jgi:protein phosphatase
MVANERIREILERTSDPQRAANELVALANDSGGEDNITVVLVDISSSSAPPPPVTEEASRPEVEGAKTDGAGPRTTPEGDTVIGMESAPVARADAPAYEPVGAEGKRDESEAPKRRSLGWRVIVPLIVLALLVGAGYAVLRYVLDNSFFVGVNDNDLVTIYRGLPDPDEFLGLSLNEVEEESSLEVTELPEFQRDDIRDSKKFSSLDDARAYVEKLENNAEALRREESRRRREKKS